MFAPIPDSQYPSPNSLLPIPKCRAIACALALFLMLLPLAACGPAALTVKREYMFWPPAPDLPHVQFLTSISSTRDVLGNQAQVESFLYGKEATTDIPFARPYGVRMYNGCIYVCDATSDNVSILDLRKKQIRILGKTGQVTLLKPIDIAIAPDGAKYVADTGHAAVIVFDADDKYAGKIAPPKFRPVSLALSGNELYVADFLGSCVRVFDRFSGAELRTIGGPGIGPGKLGGAMGVALDPHGNVFIADFVGCKVHKFTRDGKFLSSIGGQGDAPGHFVRPKHMTVDSTGILYVVDNAFANVQMFNDKGQMLMFFGASGSFPGAMELPAGICTSDSDLDLFQKYVHPDFQIQRLIIVTNNAGPNRINIYGLGALKPGKTVADLSPSRINMIGGFDTRPPITLPTLDTPTTEPGAATEPATTAPPATAPAALPATRPAPDVPGAKPF